VFITQVVAVVLVVVLRPAPVELVEVVLVQPQTRLLQEHLELLALEVAVEDLVETHNLTIVALADLAQLYWLYQIQRIQLFLLQVLLRQLRQLLQGIQY
jgi:hypothetical protein